MLYAAKPSIITEVVDVVKQFVSESSQDVLNDVALHVPKRARLGLEINGGPFQHLMKVVQMMNEPK